LKTLLLAFAPLLSGFLVKKLFKLMGLGEIMKLSGALTSGLAGVSHLSGDKGALHRSVHGAVQEKGTGLAKAYAKKRGMDEEDQNKFANKVMNGDIGKLGNKMTKASLTPRKTLKDTSHKVKDTHEKVKNHAITKKEAAMDKYGKSHAKNLVDLLNPKARRKNEENHLTDSMNQALLGDGLGLFEAKYSLGANQGGDHDAHLRKIGEDSEVIDGLLESRDSNGNIIKGNHDKLSEKAIAEREAFRATYKDRSLSDTDRRLLKAERLNNRISQLTAHNGGQSIHETDRLATLEKMESTTGLGKGSLVVPTNGAKAFAVSQIGRVHNTGNLGVDYENARSPYNYLEESFKQRRNEEDDNSYALRMQNALVEKGWMDAESGALVDMVETYGINEMDIRRAQLGSSEKINAIDGKVSKELSLFSSSVANTYKDKAAATLKNQETALRTAIQKTREYNISLLSVPIEMALPNSVDAALKTLEKVNPNSKEFENIKKETMTKLLVDLQKDLGKQLAAQQAYIMLEADRVSENIGMLSPDDIISQREKISLLETQGFDKFAESENYALELLKEIESPSTNLNQIKEALTLLGKRSDGFVENFALGSVGGLLEDSRAIANRHKEDSVKERKPINTLKEYVKANSKFKKAKVT